MIDQNKADWHWDIAHVSSNKLGNIVRGFFVLLALYGVYIYNFKLVEVSLVFLLMEVVQYSYVIFSNFIVANKLEVGKDVKYIPNIGWYIFAFKLLYTVVVLIWLIYA